MRRRQCREDYVARRRVPAFFNGMATGSGWMSAASSIGMASTLYLSGFDGLAFVLGWTGGYCLVALRGSVPAPASVAIPDLLGARHRGPLPRHIGIIGAISLLHLCRCADLRRRHHHLTLTGLSSVDVFLGVAGIQVRRSSVA